jgi:hypothetical protein
VNNPPRADLLIPPTRGAVIAPSISHGATTCRYGKATGVSRIPLSRPLTFGRYTLAHRIWLGASSKFLRILVGRVIRDIRRQIANNRARR